jgi:hypothetical protein
MDVTRHAQGKDLVIAGCRVHLRLEEQDGRWQAEGTVRCGLEDNSGVYRFRTGLYPTTEEAEQEGLRHAAAHLGNNVDRQTSRVTNWDGLAHDHTE